MQPHARFPVARTTAWVGAFLFLASLLFCFYTYSVTMGRRIPDRNAASLVFIDVLLFSAFALHHSVFARDPIRAWVRRLTGAALERSAYVWIASVMLMIVCGLWRPLPGMAWEAQGAAVWILRAVQAIGVWLTIRSAAIIDVLELAGVRQAARPDVPTEFKTIGPYGWVRHPIYAGWFAMVFAEPVMTMTRLVFALVSGVYLLIAIPMEERSIRATAGAAYARYLQRVRWKLIPGVY